MTNPTAEQARKEERDAIVAFGRQKAACMRDVAIQQLNPIFRSAAYSLEAFLEAIQRGDHREQQ